MQFDDAFSVERLTLESSVLGQNTCDANKDLELLTVLTCVFVGLPNHNLLLLQKAQLGPKCCPCTDTGLWEHQPPPSPTPSPPPAPTRLNPWSPFPQHLLSSSLPPLLSEHLGSVELRQRD